MKKLFAIAIMVFMAAGLHAATTDNDTLNAQNAVSLSVLPTKDLTRVPVQVSLTNAVPFTCLQCYLTAPDSADIFLHDGDRSVAHSPSERWNANHQAVLAWNTKRYPNQLMVMVVSTRSEDFKGNDGPIITVYLDASKLDNGDHILCMTKANAVWTDRKKTKTYNMPDAEVTFRIKHGKVVDIR